MELWPDLEWLKHGVICNTILNAVDISGKLIVSHSNFVLYCLKMFVDCADI